MPVEPLSPERLMLAGVPPIAPYSGGPRCPEDLPFPSALRAALEYLGDPQGGCNTLRTHAAPGDIHVGCSYGLHLVTSGLAFQQVWRAGDWEVAVDPTLMAPVPLDPFRHAIEATGYPFEVLTNPAAGNATPRHAALGPAADEATFRARIHASLQAGRPVLALGLVGPADGALISSYDEGGEVLIGWSFFQSFPEMNAGVAFEPTGECRVRGWYASTPALLLLGERGAAPRRGDALRSAYRRGVALVRTPALNGYAAGLAALDAWAAAMEDDANWPQDPAVRRARYAWHNIQVGQVAEERWYAAVVIGAHAAACDEPALPEHLFAAAGCYARIHRLMWDVWGCAGGIGEDEAKVAQGTAPRARRRIAALLREARAADAEAAAHLERAAGQAA